MYGFADYLQDWIPLIAIAFVLWICVAAIFSSGTTDLRAFDEKSHIDVQIYWGVKDFDPNQLDKVDFDLELDISSKESQEVVIQFCQTLRKQKFVKDVKCWVEDFQGYLDLARDPTGFDRDLWEWVTNTNEGIALKEQSYVGFIDQKLKFFMPFGQLNKTMTSFENLLTEFKVHAP